SRRRRRSSTRRAQTSGCTSRGRLRGGEGMAPPAPQEADEEERERPQECENGQQGELVCVPVDTRALGAPEAAQASQQQAVRALDRVLREPLERAAREHACRDDDDEGCGGARGGEAVRLLRAPESDHDEDDLQALEQDALEGDGERVPVETGLLFVT